MACSFFCAQSRSAALCLATCVQRPAPLDCAIARPQGFVFAVLRCCCYMVSARECLDNGALGLLASRNEVDVCLDSAAPLLFTNFACTLVLACGTSNWLCMIGLCLTYVGLVLKTAENLGALRAYTFSSHTRGTPVAVVLFLNGLKPNLSYNRKLRSLFVLVKSTSRLDSALPIMASSRAEP